MIFASDVLKHSQFKKFAKVQRIFEKEILEQGLLEGTIAGLSKYNTIHLDMGGRVFQVAVPPKNGHHLSPLVKIKNLREAIVNAKIVDLSPGQGFRLLNENGQRLKEPLFENSRVLLEVIP